MTPERVGSAVRRRLGRYRARLAGAGAVLAVSTATTLAGPFLIGYAIDHALGPRSGGRLALLSAIFLGAAVVGAVANRIQIALVGGLGERFLYDLRLEVFAHLQALSLDFYDSERTGRLVARMTSDFDAMESLVQQGLIVLVTNGLLFVVALVILAVLSWQLLLICLVVVPVLYRSSRRFQRDSKVAYSQVRERVGQTMTTVEEGITGVKVVQAFGREEHQARHFATRNIAQLEANIDAVRVSIRYFPVVEGASVVTVATMLGIGGLFVGHHVVELGTVVTFVLYLNSLFDPLQQMSQLFNQVQQSAAALAKLLGILATEVSVEDPPGGATLEGGGDLRLEGVGFSYGEKGRRAGGDTSGGASRAPMVLRDVTLAVRPGERLALVGPTGAGKSTLAKLMARLYDPTEGAIFYGGSDLRGASLASLRRRIVMVPQEGFLFHGSLLDNVRLARPGATEAEARAALEAIGALERFEKIQGGLTTTLEGRGAMLSAGERQLVALARAALAAPDVLVLDEATSSLDPGTEAAVEAAMDALTSGRTTVVIAHRLSTAQSADRIAVVEAGGIAELGTHDELVGRGGRYAALFGAWDASAR